MRYGLADVTRHEAEANEYYNTTTQKLEAVRYYGAYRVQESFLMPDGQVLVLAYNETASQPFAVGVHNASMGVYWSSGMDARRHYAWRIAESFGLTVGKEGSTAVVPASRDYATDLVEEIKEKSAAWDRAMDRNELMKVGAELEANASSLAKLLQRIGVLSRKVYESWEAVV